MRPTLARALWAMPAAVLVTLAVSGAQEPKVKVHKVQIRVDTATGTLSYSLDPVRAKRGDHIEWDCPDGGWSVHFVDKTPFVENQKTLRGKKAGPKRLPVRPDAADGRYKYFVAVAIREDIYTDDPEIIIGP